MNKPIQKKSLNPHYFLYRSLPTSLRNNSGNSTVKKRKMKQPAHKTAHSQALTHEHMLQLAKELFFCQHTSGKLLHLWLLVWIDFK